MRVALLNTFDSGGAGTATKRIHKGLRKIGVDSRMLVQIKQHDDPHVIGPKGKFQRAFSMARVVADSLPLKLYGGASGAFSVDWLPDNLSKRIEKLDPDVVHLNWIGDGFFSPTTLAEIERPIVWRLPDMWAFTGGCHYADGCERYKESCGKCPKINSNHAWDISRWTWRRKSRAWSDADITVVGPSRWIADRARESSLFGDRRIEVIPNGLDTEIYRPLDRSVARKVFGLSEEKIVILFGAQATDDPRKGFDLLRKALQRLYTSGEYDNSDVKLVVFGSSEPETPPDLEFDLEYTGYLYDDESLALLYSAVDVMVVPSRYEGFGQTASEALSCGTPVVAFDVSGPSDIIDHLQTGYLAEPYDPADLEEGIRWILKDRKRRDQLSVQAREQALARFEQTLVAEQYVDLYKDII